MGVVLADVPGRRDGVAGVQRVLVPTGPGEFVWSRQFALPLFDFALVVLHFKVKLNMRIKKTKFRHRSLYRGLAFGFICRRAVVGEGRTRHEREINYGNYKNGYCF